MALTAVRSPMAMRDQKALHPFFVKPQSLPTPEHREPAPDPIHDDTEAGPDAEPMTHGVQSDTGPKKRGRKAGSRKAKPNSNQPSLESFTIKPKSAAIEKSHDAPNGSEQPFEDGPLLEEDPNEGRRKRRKTASPESRQKTQSPPNEKEQETKQFSTIAWHQQLQAEAGNSSEVLVEASSPTREASRRTLDPIPSTPPMSGEDNIASQTSSGRKPRRTKRIPGTPKSRDVDRATAVINTAAQPVAKASPKRKVMKISSNGKLVSPSSLKPKESAATDGPQRTRKRKSTKAGPTSTVTVVRYGSDSESRRAIGARIEEIMASSVSSNLPSSKDPKSDTKPAGPLKPTHPFFLEKKKEEQTAPKGAPQGQIAPPPKTPRKSAVTPGKLRAEVRAAHSPRPFAGFGTVSGDSKIMKHPGMMEPMWPRKGTAHVRNPDSDEMDRMTPRSEVQMRALKVRKLKSNVVRIPVEENIIDILSHKFKPMLRPTSIVGSGPGRLGALRLPNRLLTTGKDVQDFVREELRAQLMRPGHAHPVLHKLYNEIGFTLTSFDKGECETQAWTQKYAPQSVADVLQTGKEAVVLRKWLESLTVLSVESGAKPSGRQEAKAMPPKRKRKKHEDEFIVDDEELNDDMDELTDPEDLGHLESRYGTKKSLISMTDCSAFGGDRSPKRKNVVLLSGPHGCGKSAMVYAVAKELGFEVFEINSSSRRSGKDIMDKVGDMTENHLVNNKAKTVPTVLDGLSAEDVDQERVSEAFQQDLETGRQGTMTSFFKAAPKAPPKPKVKVADDKKTKNATSGKATSGVQSTLNKSQPQHQKQSLILFEEVDVLFEEDQQFWDKVLKLAVQSKRPIVLTCNDENLVPMQAFSFQAILRLSPPPEDLATDYMLLMAAKEGHLLERKAIHDLYKSRDHDVRASITELNFWCQMSVGDRKGGLQWIYQRWPPGKDVDKHGRVLRVASQGTYVSGMGWFSHDTFENSGHVGYDEEEELLREAWEGWLISPEKWRSSTSKRGEEPNEGREAARSQHERLQELKRIEDERDSLSAADVYSRVGLPSSRQDAMNPSLPPMPEKEHLNYISGLPLLQIDPLFDYTNFDTKMAVASHLTLRRSSISGSLSEVDDEKTFADAILRQKHTNDSETCLSRPDFSNAFDILAEAPAATLQQAFSNQLSASSFDGTLRTIVEDLAPYVRSIVSHELRLEAERVRLSGLLSEGGRNKRMRTTRASRSAWEGGSRQSKRKERWFDKSLNMQLVMETAGKGWSGLGSLSDDAETKGTASVKSTDEE